MSAFRLVPLILLVACTSQAIQAAAPRTSRPHESVEYVILTVTLPRQIYERRPTLHASPNGMDLRELRCLSGPWLEEGDHVNCVVSLRSAEDLEIGFRDGPPTEWDCRNILVHPHGLYDISRLFQAQRCNYRIRSRLYQRHHRNSG